MPYIVSPELCRLRLRGNNAQATLTNLPTDRPIRRLKVIPLPSEVLSLSFFFLDRGAQPEIETKQSAMRKGCVVNFIYPENSLSLSVPRDLGIQGSRILPAAIPKVRTTPPHSIPSVLFW